MWRPVHCKNNIMWRPADSKNNIMWRPADSKNKLMWRYVCCNNRKQVNVEACLLQKAVHTKVCHWQRQVIMKAHLGENNHEISATTKRGRKDFYVLRYLCSRCNSLNLLIFSRYNSSTVHTMVPTAIFSGFSSAVEAFLKQSSSGPWGVIMLWRLAPPGWKPSSYMGNIKSTQSETFHG